MVDSGYSAADNLIEAESAFRCSDPNWYGALRSSVDLAFLKLDVRGVGAAILHGFHCPSTLI